MPEPKFDEPRIALNRIYTRTGDRGETGLAGGQRVPKDDPRIEAYGTVDELNAFTGAACVSLGETGARGDPALARLASILIRVQHELFNLGAILATLPEDVHPNQARITEADVQALERDIDWANAELPPLRSFVLPGGCRLNADFHICRTICRRAERLAVALMREDTTVELPVRYLNRLSDAFFVWSRWVSLRLGAAEVLWQPNQSASARET